VWIFVQEETPKRILVAYDQQIDELFSDSPLFNLKEVKESDVRLWQGKFYSSLESAISKRLTKRGKALAVYACNQSHLRDINQITLPGNESRQAVETISQNGLVHFLEKASCKPMNPDVVLYNRIYKTGSETTRALFCFVAAMMDYSYTKGEYERFPLDQKFQFEFPKFLYIEWNSIFQQARRFVLFPLDHISVVALSEISCFVRRNLTSTFNEVGRNCQDMKKSIIIPVVYTTCAIKA